MSLLSLSQHYVALPIGNTINIFCRNTGKLLFQYECDGTDITKLAEQKSNDCTKNDNTNNNQNSTKTQQITNIVYSSKHNCFIIVTDDKRLRILIHKAHIQSLSKEEDQHIDFINSEALFQLYRYKKLDKKISSMCLSPLKHKDDQEYILTANKMGAICMRNLPLLTTKFDATGHLSIISHITFDSSGTYLMSADKDFKIRISRFPQLYIIDGFCYGHTEAVTTCVIIDRNRNSDDTKYILSGSVDGTMRFWSIPSGQQLSICKFRGKNNELELKDEMKTNESNVIIFDIDCDLNDLNHERLIVTDIKYFEPLGMVAVSVNRSSKIYLFGLVLEDVSKPKLILLDSFKLLSNCDVFNGLYDMMFDENGNLMTLICCKELNENNDIDIYLSLDVFVITKQNDNTLSVQSAKDNMIIQMIQKQTKEISLKMENCPMVPSYLGLLRTWGVTDERKRNYKTEKISGNEHTQPPQKKQKILNEV